MHRVDQGDAQTIWQWIVIRGVLHTGCPSVTAGVFSRQERQLSPPPGKLGRALVLLPATMPFPGASFVSNRCFLDFRIARQSQDAKNSSTLAAVNRWPGPGNLASPPRPCPIYAGSCGSSCDPHPLCDRFSAVTSRCPAPELFEDAQVPLMKISSVAVHVAMTGCWPLFVPRLVLPIYRRNCPKSMFAAKNSPSSSSLEISPAKMRMGR
jgi:hypothetical protein